jgi:CubicO group peptidase (beta-lactamase class C family)
VVIIPLNQKTMSRLLPTFLTIFCIGLFLFPTANAQQKAELETVISEFQTQIEQAVAEDKNNGSISIIIFKGKEVLWSGGYGYANVTKKVKANPAKIYRTGSISKTITAFLMLQLVDEGIIKLDDPVEQYLPEIKGLEGYADSTKVTFHHLASHTSGLIREPKLKGAAAGPIEQWEEKVLASIPETSFQTGMDVQYSYSNIGFGILGLALSRAAGKPFMELVEEKIFQPLKMKRSYFIVPKSKVRQLAIGMRSDGRGMAFEQAAKEHRGRGYKVPNGGVYSTPEDLMKFMNAIMGYSKVLSAESQALMVASHTPEDNYGYGLSLFQDEDISTAGHGGSVAGYNCYMAFDQESEYGVILMRNYNRGKTNLGRASRELIRILKGL